MQRYNHFPIISGKADLAEELNASFATKITLICAEVSGVEVPLHERPLSIKATLRGEEIFAFGQHRVPLTPGKVLLAPAHHCYSSIVPEKKTAAVSLFFPDHLTRSAMALYTRNGRQMLLEGRDAEAPLADFPAHCGPPSHRALPLLKRMAENIDEAEACDLALQCLTLTVEAVIQARGEIVAIPAVRTSVQQELFRRASLAREALDEQPARNWSLGDLGTIACLSHFHLHRVFGAAFGLTPFQYLKRRRVLLAQELLRTTNRPIKVIAAEVGFESAPSFIRCFRLETGISPGRYREKEAA